MADSGSVLRINANVDDLEAMRRFVKEKATALGADPSAVCDLVLAVDEIVTNIVCHGYRGEPGTIEILVQQAGDALEVHITDHAPLFDPTEVPPPDLTVSPWKRIPGGLGIHLARNLTDSMAYRVTDGRNELVLVKRGILENSAHTQTSP